MSRVEPKEHPPAARKAEEGRRQQHSQQHDTPPIAHTPSQAEGDERTVNEALRHQDEKRR